MQQHARNRLTATLVAVLVAGSGMVAVPAVADEAATPAIGPDGDAFYLPPDPLPPGDPGDLIWYRELEPSPFSPVRGWRVLYHSRARDGSDVAVSGYVVAPDGPAPPGGWPLESVGHPTAGIGDCDAPSRWAVPHGADDRVVAYTDYEGLGPPGPHPYLVGATAGRNVLDIARAASGLPDLALDGRVALSGFSQGGQAAVLAGELAATYAPELDVIGAVAQAPPTDLSMLSGTAPTTSAAIGYALYVVWGYAHAYGLDLDEVLTPAAISALETEAACAPGPGVWSIDPDDAFVLELGAMPPHWGEALADNDAGHERSVPILVVAGAQDPVVPLPVVEAYVARACAAGTHVDLIVLEDWGHAAAPILSDQWIDDRLAGVPLGASSCDRGAEEPPPPVEPVPPTVSPVVSPTSTSTSPPASPVTVDPQLTG